MTAENSVVSLKSDGFEAFIKKNPLVFVDFWAPWCQPCLNFANIYHQVAERFPDVIFAKVNIDEESMLAETFYIRSIPHLMVFKEGVAIYSEAGSMPASTLTELVEQAIAADVSEIRKKIGEE